MNKSKSMRVVPIPGTREGRLALAATAGAAMNQNPGLLDDANLPVILETRITAVERAEDILAQKRTVVTTTRRDRREAHAELNKRTKVSMNQLRSLFGNTWNADWERMNMVPGKVATPRSMDGKLALLMQVSLFLQEHPELENAALNFTAVKIAELHARVIGARSAFLAATTARKQAKEFIALEDERLKTALIQVRTALRVFGPDSPQWETFGFRVPAAERTPGQVVNVIAEATGNGSLEVVWDPVPRAEFYRIFVQGPGSGDKLEVKVRTTDTGAEVDGLTAGLSYKIVVRAGNAGGEGVASEAVTVVVE